MWLLSLAQGRTVLVGCAYTHTYYRSSPGHLQFILGMCWMMQHESSLAHGSLTAACLICSTLSYTGWTSIDVFGISSELQFIGASRIVLPSTWGTAECTRLTFPVVSAWGRPNSISWLCHDTVAANLVVDRSPLQLRWSGTHFGTLFKTKRWALTTLDRSKDLRFAVQWDTWHITCVLQIFYFYIFCILCIHTYSMVSSYMLLLGQFIYIK